MTQPRSPSTKPPGPPSRPSSVRARSPKGASLAFDDVDGHLYVADARANRVEQFAFINVADVSTGAASGLGTEGATLNGTVNPNGTDAHCVFEYGTAPPTAHTAPCEPEDVGSGESPNRSMPRSPAWRRSPPTTTGRGDRAVR